MPTATSSLPGVAAEERREAGEEGHEGVAPRRRASAERARASSAGSAKVSVRAAEGLDRRPRMVDRQLQALRDAGELPPPIVELRCEPFAGQPFALPDREVGVLDRQLRQRRRRALARTRRRGSPARANRMPIDQPSETMWCRFTSSVCSRAAMRSRAARTSGPRARSNGRRASSRDSRASSPPPDVVRQPVEIDQRDVDGRRRCDHLDGGRRHRAERGAQRLVAADDLAEGSAQGVQVERAGQAHGGEHVVERVVRRQAVEEPEALLGERERQVAVRGAPAGWARAARRSPRRAPSMRAASAATVGASKKRAQRQLHPEGLAHPRHHLRREERVAAQGRRSRPCAPTLSRRPSTSAQISASTSSTGPCAAPRSRRRAPRPAPAAGRAPGGRPCRWASSGSAARSDERRAAPCTRAARPRRARRAAPARRRRAAAGTT